MASVRLTQLVKEFEPGKGKAAVAGVTMEIADGEFLVLVGPSGCGKTTVLRMIAGLETPTSGSIHIGHEHVTDLSPRERDVAMVFQNYALYPHMTVRENIGFPLRMRRCVPSEISRRVGYVADLLAIGEYLDRQPGQLSGGQRQRVALARAMVREPAVFLFDEPLSNLDAQIRASTRAELVRLHRALGATMIHVTHDQVEALSMAQRVGVMRAGRIEQLAPPLEVYRTPATLFTAGFIGSPTINCLTGHVEHDGTGGFLFSGAMRVPVSIGVNGPVTLCFRPEHLRVTEGEGRAGAEVTLVEPSGADLVVHLRLATGEELRLRRPDDESNALFPGAVVRLELDAQRALVYGREGQLVGRGR
jgi:ABC-type sugar transport system ATPase subunit